MTALDLSSPVAVVGTGTMGQGIAQVALVAGHPVRLYDAAAGPRPGGGRRDRRPAGPARREGPAHRRRPGRRARPAAARPEPRRARRLRAWSSRPSWSDWTSSSELFARAGGHRRRGLSARHQHLVPVGHRHRAAPLRNPGRFVGLHFFNPAPLLPLVEVVSGFATDVASATRAYETARAWGKTPVRLRRHPRLHRQPHRPALLRRGLRASTRSGSPTPPPSTPCCASAAASGWAPSS